MEEIPDVVTGMLKVFNFDVYTLLDLSANLCSVTYFLATKFDISHEMLSKPFSVYTPMGESVVARRVYQGCLM